MFMYRAKGWLLVVAALVLGLLWGGAAAQADTFTPNPAHDAVVKENSASSNFGSDLVLKTQNTLGSGSTEYRSFLRFDLSSYSGTLNSATFKVMPEDSSSSGFALYKISNDSWTESSVTWNNQPGGSSLTGATHIADSGSVSDGVLKTMTVTSSVTLGQQVTFVMVGKSSSSISYTSEEASSNKPVLELNVTLPTTTTAGQTAPTVTTGSATAGRIAVADLAGTVNPNGASTTCEFQYGLTNSYGSTASTTSPGAGSSSVAVAKKITNLSQNTLYHFRLSCTNSGGTTNGSDATFTTSNYPQFIWTSGSNSGNTDAELDSIAALGYDGILANAGDTTLFGRLSDRGLKALAWFDKYYDYNDTDMPPGFSNCEFAVSDTTVDSQVAAIKTHAALYGYLIADEPHVGNQARTGTVCWDAPDDMADRSVLIKAEDTASTATFHPTIITENQGYDYDEFATGGATGGNVTDILGLVAYPCHVSDNQCTVTTIQNHINDAYAAGWNNWWSMPQINGDSGANYKKATSTELPTVYGWWHDTDPTVSGTGSDVSEGAFTFLWDGCGSCDGLAGDVDTGNNLGSVVTTENLAF